MILQFNDKNENVKILQRLLEIYDDGHYGNQTKNAVIQFQEKNGLVADGIAGPATLNAIGFYANNNNNNNNNIQSQSKFLTEKDYLDAAYTIGCDVASIKAVVEVESKGSGFLNNGDVKILFEPHIFWRELRNLGIDPNKYTSGNSDILYQNWKTGAYGSTNIQWSKMNRAIKINKEAALKSASYGKFQIMGFNHKLCGYNKVTDFVNNMMESERYHLLAFIEFIKNRNLTKFLINRNWEKFAEGYNGKGYKENKYDTKLMEAYKKYS